MGGREIAENGREVEVVRGWVGGSRWRSDPGMLAGMLQHEQFTVAR